jgi:Ca-activated chloride channel family protein
VSALHFLAPFALIALAPLAGIIILLYLLKLRRREVVVPSVFLWRRAVQDMQANAPFQRLQRNLLLLLQLLALAAMVFGLAAPFVLAARLGGKSVVIVLDASASMAATDVSPSRFAEAKTRALQITRGMNRRDEAALIVVASRAWVAVPFTRDLRKVQGAIREVQVTDCMTNMRDALLLAFSLAGKRPKATVYVVSDGGFGPLPEVASTADLRFIRVGARRDNVAILAFEASRQQGSQNHQLFLRLQNYASEAKSAVVSFCHEDELIDAHRVTLKPNENRGETYQLTLKRPGLLRAEVEVKDDLASDNVAYAFADLAADKSVLLVTPGNLFLEQALLVLPEVSLYKASGLSASEAEEAYQQYAAVIFDRVAPPRPPRTGGVMLIATDGPGASLGESRATPSIDRWVEDHPALRYVNLSVVQMEKATTLKPAAGARVIAESRGAPLIVAYERPGLRTLSLGWNFLDSDFPLRVGFPILLANSISWLSQSGSGGTPQRLRPGAVVGLPVPPEAKTAQVTLPDRSRREVAVAGGIASFAESDRVGVYTMQAGGQTQRWAVDLRSVEESDLKPADQLTLGTRAVRATAGPPRAELHFWPWLALLALVVLLVEWRLYHQRS